MEDIFDVKTIFTQEHVLSWKNLAMALRINERCVEVSFYSLSRLLNEDNQKKTACIFPGFFRKKPLAGHGRFSDTRIVWFVGFEKTELADFDEFKNRTWTVS